MSVRRYAALAAVLTGGVCAALPYLKSSPVAAPQLQPDTSTPGNNPTQVMQAPQIAVDSTPARAYPEDEPPQLEKLPEWCRPQPISVPVDGGPLPILPRIPLVRQARSSHISEPDFNATTSTGSADSISPPAPPPKVAAPRRHRITDGDSLSGLALRYLGDERRGDEIAQLNRQQIRDPHLLPVGVEILIPRREQ